jgi:hypothetical protein
MDYTLLMEVRMPSSIIKRAVVVGMLCTTCTMHSTTAHADSQTGPWSSYFDCVKKDSAWPVASASFGALVGGPRVTDKGAHSVVDAFTGARVAMQVTPNVLSAVRSPRTRVLLRISMYASGALAAYQWWVCQ